MYLKNETSILYLALLHLFSNHWSLISKATLQKCQYIWSLLIIVYLTMCWGWSRLWIVTCILSTFIVKPQWNVKVNEKMFIPSDFNQFYTQYSVINTVQISHETLPLSITERISQPSFQLFICNNDYFNFCLYFSNTTCSMVIGVQSFNSQISPRIKPKIKELSLSFLKIQSNKKQSFQHQDIIERYWNLDIDQTERWLS